MYYEERLNHASLVPCRPVHILYGVTQLKSDIKRNSYFGNAQAYRMNEAKNQQQQQKNPKLIR